MLQSVFLVWVTQGEYDDLLSGVAAVYGNNLAAEAHAKAINDKNPEQLEYSPIANVVECYVHLEYKPNLPYGPEDSMNGV